jgi:hypothetical protein
MSNFFLFIKPIQIQDNCIFQNAFEDIDQKNQLQTQDIFLINGVNSCRESKKRKCIAFKKNGFSSHTDWQVLTNIFKLNGFNF